MNVGIVYLLAILLGYFIISTSAKYPWSENLYKMLIDHLYKMTQAIQKFFFEIGLPVDELSKITTRCQMRVRKNTKLNFEALLYGRKLVLCQNFVLVDGESKFGV